MIDDHAGLWRRQRMTEVATILHRATLAVMVGKRTFERGEKCFAAGRVIDVVATGSELRGTVRPEEARRSPYTVRVWVRDEGIAYQCTCPIGEQAQFCKHTVAVALAHLDRDQRSATARALSTPTTTATPAGANRAGGKRATKPSAALTVLRARLSALRTPELIDRLIELAQDDVGLCAALETIVAPAG